MFGIVILKLKTNTAYLFVWCACCGGVGVVGSLWIHDITLLVFPTVRSVLFLVVESQLTNLDKRCPFCFSQLITTFKVYYGTGWEEHR